MSSKKTEVTEVVWKDETIALDRPKSSFELAKGIKKIIVENQLYTPIKGKNYVNVEGWQLAGMLVGIYPRIKTLERVETGTDEVKYRAEAALFNLKDGKTVGYGVALCSDKEHSKRSFDEYAIASMAQTRAISKAFRLTLGWLLKLAGYEATPADETADDTPKLSPNEGETVEERVANISKDFTKPIEAPTAATPKQLIWLKTTYIRQGLTHDEADEKAKSFKTQDEVKAEILRLSKETPEAEE